MTASIVFIDTETVGLEPGPDVIWEFAGVRRDPGIEAEAELHLFIAHDLDKITSFPDRFRRDHDARFDLAACVPRAAAATRIAQFFAPTPAWGRVHVVGAVPNFDTERIELLLAEHGFCLGLGHHYHLQDVENWAGGYLAARAEFDPDLTDDQRRAMAALTHPPYDSDELSRAVGVEPLADGVRHTAMGDVRWCMAIWDAIHAEHSKTAHP